MRRVTYRDKKGVLQCSLIRDCDDPNFPEIGIQLEPPPIESAIMSAIPEVREYLISRGVFTYQDVAEQQTAITDALQIIRRKIVEVYKLKELNNNGK